MVVVCCRDLDEVVKMILGKEEKNAYIFSGNVFIISYTQAFLSIFLEVI